MLSDHLFRFALIELRDRATARSRREGRMMKRGGRSEIELILNGTIVIEFLGTDRRTNGLDGDREIGSIDVIVIVVTIIIEG